MEQKSHHLQVSRFYVFLSLGYYYYISKRSEFLVISYHFSLYSPLACQSIRFFRLKFLVSPAENLKTG